MSFMEHKSFSKNTRFPLLVGDGVIALGKTLISAKIFSCFLLKNKLYLDKREIYFQWDVNEQSCTWISNKRMAHGPNSVQSK